MTARDRTPIVHAPGVLRIPLTRGLFALIDEADAPIVAPYLWIAQRGGSNCKLFYASRVTPRPERRFVLMHREVLLTTAREVDHINGDGLDNRRANLRPATSSQNKYNRPRLSTNRSGFIGVSFASGRGRWLVTAKSPDGKMTFLGYATTAHEGAIMYDRYVLKTRGEFAVTNLPHGTTTS